MSNEKKIKVCLGVSNLSENKKNTIGGVNYRLLILFTIGIKLVKIA